MKSGTFFIISILSIGWCYVLVQGVLNSLSPQPEQIHISTTGDLLEIVVTWTTLTPARNSFVEYGYKGQPLSNRIEGNSTPYKTCGFKKRYIFMHRATLSGLSPLTTYDYRCGGDDGWSAIYTFNTTQRGTNWSPSFAVYGDLGVGNAQSLSQLQTEVQTGQYDAILHVGDFAYDMHHEESRVADAFMNQIETMAAYVPYMVCPGNHEQYCNFSNYRERFSMPGDNQGIFYSWNIGPVHIISFSTEVYYFLQYGLEQLVNQYKWLQKDLEEANLPHNRAKRPWIITMAHRPMYCSNMVDDACQNYENEIRTGITALKLFPLEELFYKHGVDLQIWAHEHSYERLFPVYDHKIYNGSKNEPYTNPCAPVHITTGSAGCKYCHDKFQRHYGPWTAFRTLDYGYTRMKVFNRTHLYLEQVSIDKNNTVIDKMWLIKEKHGPGSCNLGVPSDYKPVTYKTNTETSQAMDEITQHANTRSKISKNLHTILEHYSKKLKLRENPY